MYKLDCFLVSTDHLTERLWFRDDEDFKVGMNYVALVSLALGIHVLAFILMSNHIHLVLACSEEEALRFITEYKRRYSKYYQKKYSVKEFLRRNGVDIRPVATEEESLERAVAYVQMNSVAANICSHPSFYPWGTGGAFFRADAPKGTPLTSLSRREQIRILHSNDLIPDSLRLSEEGYIIPASFVAVKFVEQLFRQPSRYNFFLHNSSKARLRLQEGPLPSFRDQSILAAVPDLCVSLFRKRTLGELSSEQTGELLKQLRFRFSADAAQLSRVLSIPYEEVSRHLDSI